MQNPAPQHSITPSLHHSITEPPNHRNTETPNHRLPAPPSAQDARQSLNACATEVGARIYERYGPRIGWAQLLRILQDRECVRYPCEIIFDAAQLQAGELAHPVAKGDHPQDGFIIYIHPF